jgi:hypothetical protein
MLERMRQVLVPFIKFICLQHNVKSTYVHTQLDKVRLCNMGFKVKFQIRTLTFQLYHYY